MSQGIDIVPTLGTVGDVVVSLDQAGRITGFNPAAERLFGRSREEVLGKLLAEVVTPPRKGSEQALLASEERFRLLVQSVKDYAIFMLDAQGCIATWNSGELPVVVANCTASAAVCSSAAGVQGLYAERDHRPALLGLLP